MRRRSILFALAGVTLASACSKNDNSESSTSPGGDGQAAALKVVASTNVWAAVAREVAGDAAAVTAVVSNAAQDPHDYEASAQDKLAFNDATVVVVNGGGYDDWATTLAKTAKKATIVDATDASGIEGAGQEGFNEHVWYSLDTAKNVALKVAEALGKADSAKASDFDKRAKEFNTKLDELAKRAAAIGTKHSKTGYVATEPVGHYLYQTMGLVDLTPEQYNEQSETDAGPSVAVVDQTTKVIKGGQVKFLSANPQTEDAASAKLVAAAKEANVPQVQASELIDGDASYVDFVTITIEQVEKALG